MKNIIALLVIMASVAGSRAFAEQAAATQTASLSRTNEVATTHRIKLTVVKVDSEETAGENGSATNAVDGNPETFWHTEWQDANPAPPHEIILKLNEPVAIAGFTYLPRQDDSDHGLIKDYEFFMSDDGKDFGKPVKKGTFDSSREKKTISFDGKKCQFIKLRALSEVNGEAWTAVAEIGVIPAD